MGNFAIIVAGGKSRRMGTSDNKCFMKLAGREIILWTIEVFERCKEISGIACVVGNKNEVSLLKNLLSRNNLGKDIIISATEGEKRQDGVWGGIKTLKKLNLSDNDIILIHNGANPLVKTPDILLSISAAREYGASVCATPVKDTIKRVDEGFFAKETLNRSELWAMQTPQTMKYGLAIKAFESAFKDKFYGTDDVQLVERIGGRVKIVECSSQNFKITTPEDIHLAEEIIKNQAL